MDLSILLLEFRRICVTRDSEGIDYVAKGGHFGPHNLYENRPDGFVSSELIVTTYQNAGVRVADQIHIAVA